MPDDMQTFRQLAEKCFAIKPSIDPLAECEPFQIRMELWDNIAAWALLNDLLYARVKGTHPIVLALDNAVFNMTHLHLEIAQCWLAANKANDMGTTTSESSPR